MENRIKERIKQVGITQIELAEKLKISKVGMNQIVRSSMPKIETFERIAEAIDVPVWSLFLSDEEIYAICKLNENKQEKEEEQAPMRNPFEFNCPACGETLTALPVRDLQHNH